MTFRWHWGHSITAVYTLFAAGTLTFVAFAVRQPVDLVSADYYARSLDHDRRQAAAGRAEALEPAIVAAVSADGRTLIVGIPGADTRTLDGRARFYRPSNAAEDRSWALSLDPSGLQHLPIGDVPRGRWILQLEWTAGGVPYYVERAIALP